MFKKSNVGDQLLIAVKLNKISEISRLVALGVNVDSRIDKVSKHEVCKYVLYSFTDCLFFLPHTYGNVSNVTLYSFTKWRQGGMVA